MACERCGQPVASDAAIVRAALSTTNGQSLNLKIVLTCEPLLVGGRAPCFCDACFTYFLQMFGEIGHVVRIKNPASDPARN